ncbi:50S ribosomal protein L21 [Candidatus Dojkabacteria bacterium]|nr:50S ribosomal protein L21 [Candidatus Dojkabacteria bacterium]
MNKEFYVIELGGVQHIVSAQEEITVNKIEGKVGDSISIDKVLLHQDDDKVEIGAPYLTTKLSGEIVKQFKGKKLNMVTFKAKSRHRRRVGHRQMLTTVKIITGSAKPVKSEPKAKKSVQKPSPKTAKKPTQKVVKPKSTKTKAKPKSTK